MQWAKFKMKYLSVLGLGLGMASLAEAAITSRCVNQSHVTRALLIHYGNFESLFSVQLATASGEAWVPGLKQPGLNKDLVNLAIAKKDNGEVVLVSRDMSEANVFDATGKQTDHLSCAR